MKIRLKLPQLTSNLKIYAFLKKLIMSNYLSGTQQDKKDIAVLSPLISKAVTESY